MVIPPLVSDIHVGVKNMTKEQLAESLLMSSRSHYHKVDYSERQKMLNNHEGTVIAFMLDDLHTRLMERYYREIG